MEKRSGLGIFLTKRLIKLVTLLVAICIVTFVLLELSPIDPVTAYVGASTKVGAEQRALIAEHWGLNKPPIERFMAWFTSIIRGDWGTSMIYRRPVLEVIGQKFLSSLALMAVAWTLSGVLGFVLGIIAGVYEGKAVDKVIRAYCHILISTPSFWLGILFIMLFAVELGWFPVAISVPIGVLAEDVSLADRLSHLILPSLTLSLIGISNICLHTRQKVVDILSSDFVLFAKARGESKRSIIHNHVIKNASLPAITLQFLSFSELFGGAVFVEQVFSYPGLGQATVQSGLRGDLPLLMGIVIISLIFVYVGNMTADLLYMVIDPRIKEGQMA
ncbi:MAG: ABC transporter permease [Syntrophaceticus sp.]|mgnify:CR=1 FL=1|nr:ABC transporter permease [Syntrophaceticus sp.]MDD3314791.1 ABC transporter permease [Syntrophaceticus sp.]MDD4360366.1 ABC transporter permease [Syntrophaceticus sp.]MDD4783473.1 ABC transporter permease [Syntrophaceticus sp.]